MPDTITIDDGIKGEREGPGAEEACASLGIMDADATAGTKTPNELRVRVVRARGLTAVDGAPSSDTRMLSSSKSSGTGKRAGSTTGSSDPFVTLSLGGGWLAERPALAALASSATCKTSVKKKDLDPM